MKRSVLLGMAMMALSGCPIYTTSIVGVWEGHYYYPKYDSSGKQTLTFRDDGTCLWDFPPGKFDDRGFKLFYTLDGDHVHIYGAVYDVDDRTGFVSSFDLNTNMLLNSPDCMAGASRRTDNTGAETETEYAPSVEVFSRRDGTTDNSAEVWTGSFPQSFKNPAMPRVSEEPFIIPVRYTR